LRTVAAAACAALLLLWMPQASGASSHRAGVLVRDPSGHLHRMCVFFDTATTNGLDVLKKAGYDTTLNQSSLGAAVCKIENTGCSARNCFCHYPKFWGYWTREPGATRWRFSDVGAQARTVHDGSLDAWVWGKDGGPAPPRLAFIDVCALAASDERRSTAPKRKTNYAAFGAFVAAFAGLGVVLARRRATRRP
jgi:hypothetical protein